MAISGTWAERSANASAYTGARRWGTGVNPVHAIRDNPGRVTGIKENLYPLGDISDAPPEQLLDSDYFTGPDWDGEQPYPGEDFRYQDDEPRWGTATETFRDDTHNAVAGEWAPWGVYNDSNPVDGFPLPGPTGGMDTALDISHGEDQERQRAIAAPTRGVSGGWLNKARGQVPQNEAQAIADPTAQWAVNTGQVQGPGLLTRENTDVTGAAARGTDSPREAIRSRTAGMVVRQFPRSFEQGGGPGVADMFPRQQTAGLKRPFVTRRPGLPPDEAHFMNTMEGREPLQRTVPPDPYQGDPETAGATPGTAGIYDYGAPEDGGDIDWGVLLWRQRCGYPWSAASPGAGC